MAIVRRERVVDLPIDDAFDLWADPRRWPTFIDGFGRLEHADGGWPAAGSKLVWHSRPAGRGKVSEKVLDCERPARFATRVVEERLFGTQTVAFVPLDEEATSVEMSLDYTLTTGGPLRFVTDVFFIRRAQGDALARTLRRFAIEAAEQAAL